MVYPSLVTIFVPLLVGDKVMFSNSGVTVCIHHCVAKGVGGCSRHNPYHTGHIEIHKQRIADLFTVVLPLLFYCRRQFSCL